MPHLYILKNKVGKHYIGITVLNPEERLERHNSGGVVSTKVDRPWELIYTEIFTTIKEAREKEKKVKSWKGGNVFRKFIAKAAGSSNGRTHPSGGWYLGSNPSPAALGRKKNLAG